MVYPSQASLAFGAGTSRQRRKHARPQELLDAALDLFVQKGYAATRAEEVAIRAGVSKGTLYRYYPSKEELLKAVLRNRLSNPIQAAAIEADEHAGNASDLLRRLVAPWWLQVVEGPASGVFKLVVAEARSFPEIAEFYRFEMIEPGRQLVGRILRRGIATGEFRAVDIDAAVNSLLLPMIMLCVQRYSVGACAGAAALNARGFIEQHVDLFVRGLRTADDAVLAPSRRAAK